MLLPKNTRRHGMPRSPSLFCRHRWTSQNANAAGSPSEKYLYHPGGMPARTTPAKIEHHPLRSVYDGAALSIALRHRTNKENSPVQTVLLSMRQPLTLCLQKARPYPIDLSILLRPVGSLIFILWFSGILMAGSSPAEVLLKKAETAIDRGQLPEARRCIDNLQAYRLTSTQQSAFTLLEARILQDRGLIRESMDKLKIFIGEGQQRNIPATLQADAYIAYARNCRSLIWLELFNNALDSLGALVRQHGLSDPYRMAFHTNKALYHLLQIHSDRAKPSWIAWSPFWNMPHQQNVTDTCRRGFSPFC